MIHEPQTFIGAERFDPAVLAPLGRSIPADILAEHAAIVLLEPEPKVLRDWMGRLERKVRRASAAPAWSILLVSPHMERKVAAALGPKSAENPHGAGLRVHVPMERYQPATTWRSRTRPMMPGYLLAELKDDDDLDLARSNHAVREVMSRDGKPVRLPAIWVGALVLAEAWGAFDLTRGAPKPTKLGKNRKLKHRWEKGQRVAITDGPIAGFIAQIQCAERPDRIAVLVEMFGRLTPTELDEEMLQEPAPET